ncbi:MAG: MBOAT family O-acyltransferase [Oscillospiraceae bacterium]
MSFTTFAFMGFVIIIFALYHIMPTRLKPYVLCGANIYFCLSFSGTLPYLMICTVLVWGAGLLLERSRNKASLLPLMLILLCLMPLVFYKYLPFLASLTAPFIPVALTLSPLLEKLLVPMGISYFTLKNASYLIDIKRLKLHAEPNLIRYWNCAAFFPQLTAGPIQRPCELLPQLNKACSFNAELAYISCGRIAYGIFLKLCIADNLSKATSLLQDFKNAHELALIFALLFYSVQIYCDFAGYSEISIGVAGLLGYEVGENFISPYTALTVQDFWRRWHISLSSFLKDYVYIPLGGNRKGKMRKYLNLLCIFALSGLWHGAGAGYIVWGLLHGVYMCVGSLTLCLRKRIKAAIHLKEDSRFQRIFATLCTFALVTLAWLFFAVPNISTAFQILNKMVNIPIFNWFYVQECLTMLGFTVPSLVRMLIFILIVFGIDISSRKIGFGKWYADLPHKWHIVLLYACVLCVLFFSAGSGGDFIYFKF